MSADVADLQRRLAHHPVGRYPVQHATTSFHLGVAHLQAGRPEPAAAALRTAQQVFADSRLAVEAAKAGLMLGIALRAAGQRQAAADQFTRVAGEFAELGHPAEEGAALHNLGLVQAELGDLGLARRTWQQARDRFATAGRPGQAAAAGREIGTSLIAAGRPQEAVDLLTAAVAEAEAADDQAGAGAGANLLGLALLGVDEPAAAVTALRLAVGSHPRLRRPAEHAMATANLALAHQACGDDVRARVLARQALAVPQAAPPVRQQARALLTRAPADAAADLQALVVGAPVADWQPLLRVELADAAAAGPGACRQLCTVLLTAVLADQPAASHQHSAADEYERAQALLALVLELPPAAFQTMLVALDTAAAQPTRPAAEQQRLHAVIGSALARFALPQWQRVVAGLNAAAAARDGSSPWN